MQLDWECVRAIILEVESLESDRDLVAPGSLPRFDEDDVVEHVRLLCEAGLLEGDPLNHPQFARRLTWDGHELAATLRDRGFWKQVRREAKQRGIALTVATIGAIAKAVTQRLLM